MPDSSRIPKPSTPSPGAGGRSRRSNRRRLPLDRIWRSHSTAGTGAIRGGFVHHTAGGNSYSQSDVPGIIRGVYAYQVNGQGWRDIGYNFLIDRFGRIWEGRYGGVTRAVVGAHTQGYNSNAFAASVLGTYTSKTPESAVLNAYATLLAWSRPVRSELRRPRAARWPSGSWRHARYADVDGGTGTTVLRPSRSQAYRLRAVTVTSPSSVDTSHPAGTSNEFRVVVG